VKIPKRMIIKCAENLLISRGEVSQLEVHRAIEQKLNRTLSRHEKTRITQMLRNVYIVDKREIEGKTKKIVEYFRY